jgi:hypothetical protein
MKGDQFAPIEAPYLKLWRERLADKDTPRPTKELDKVVAQIKKGKLPKRRK